MILTNIVELSWVGIPKIPNRYPIF